MLRDRDAIQVQYPLLNHTESIANISITKKEVIPENGITIPNAFSSIHNSLFLIIENNNDTSNITVKAGNAYPNSMLGDVIIEIPSGTSAIRLQDLARFEKIDGSLDIDFSENFVGNIYAIAEWAK